MGFSASQNYKSNMPLSATNIQKVAYMCKFSRDVIFMSTETFILKNSDYQDCLYALQ